MPRTITHKAFCYSCGSTETYIDKHGWVHWATNNDVDRNVLCWKCFCRLIVAWKWAPINAPKQMESHGKNWILKERGLIGVCNWCRAVLGFDCKITQRHHDEDRFDPEHPEKYVIELCVSCHRKTFPSRKGIPRNMKTSEYRRIKNKQP